MAPAYFKQSLTPDALRAYLAEFISTFFYVFAVVGSAMASRKLMSDSATDPSSLVLVAVANTFALSSAVYMAANVSGGHVNPAVTFGMAVGGHISVSTALFYWVSQMSASVVACLLLKIATVSQDVPIYTIANEMTGFGASLVEGVVAFGLVSDGRSHGAGGGAVLGRGNEPSISVWVGGGSGSVQEPGSLLGGAVYWSSRCWACV
ncbi:hypothetical protein V6N11_028669 [Hibiscus sabdariffa]|uniref:Aquaporin TIP5-1 n=1 Tax=Hibiscus sabdariffa TaxID=183260 RepID=A0ABR2PQR1_9ROSI